MKITAAAETSISTQLVDTDKINQAMRSWAQLNTSLKEQEFSIAELRLMIAYELENKNRPDVLHRIVKLHTTQYDKMVSSFVKEASVEAMQKKSINTISDKQSYNSVETP